MSVPAPRPEAASNPHDAYTQSVFRELPQARGFLRGYLPDEVRELFDWRTLRLQTGSFLSDQLHRYISRQLEETPDGQPLPSILTVVLLQSGTWNRSRTLSSEYDFPGAARGILAPYRVNFRIVMVELGSLDESELKGTQATRRKSSTRSAVFPTEPPRRPKVSPNAVDYFLRVAKKARTVRASS